MMFSVREAERMFDRFTDKDYGAPITLLHRGPWLSLWEHCENAPPGDFVECGVMRGGAAMLMARYGRNLWLFDSWEGIPHEKNTRYGRREDDLGHPGECRASMHECLSNFILFNIPTDKCEFVKGWIKDTASQYNGDGIAILRLDVDIYSSTREALEGLYPHVVEGGIVIIDDYCFPQVRNAVHEYLDVVVNEVKDIYGNDHQFLENSRGENSSWQPSIKSPATASWFIK